jgi:hypothetical protein
MGAGVHNLACGFNPVNFRHMEIHQDDVGLRPLRQPYGFSAARCFTHQLNIGYSYQECLQSRQCGLRIVSYEKMDGVAFHRHSLNPAVISPRPLFRRPVVDGS